MQHVTGRNIESARAQSVPLQGSTQAIPWYVKDSWYTYDGGNKHITGAPAPGTNVFGFGPALLSDLAGYGVGGQVATWNGTAEGDGVANGGAVLVDLLLDDQFAADGDTKTPQIVFKLMAGKSGFGTNNNLGLTVEVYAIALGAEPVAITSDVKVMSAKSATGNFTEFDEYQIDVGSGARASDTASLLVPGTLLIVRIYPNKAPGANVNLSLLGGQWILNRHDSLATGKTRLGRRS